MGKARVPAGGQAAAVKENQRQQHPQSAMNKTLCLTSMQTRSKRVPLQDENSATLKNQMKLQVKYTVKCETPRRRGDEQKIYIATAGDSTNSAKETSGERSASEERAESAMTASLAGGKSLKKSKSAAQPPGRNKSTKTNAKCVPTKCIGKPRKRTPAVCSRHPSLASDIPFLIETYRILEGHDRIFMKRMFPIIGESRTRRHSLRIEDIPLEQRQGATSLASGCAKSPPGRYRKVTDYYSIRRSYRKCEGQLKSEEKKVIDELIRTGKEEGMKVSMIDGKGRGVMATKSFQRGEFVVEYHGDLIEFADAKSREAEYAQDPSTGCYMYYFQYLSKTYCVDATKETTRLGRLINHSKNGNCQTKLHDVDGKPHLILVASRDIKDGEELLYDYGDRSKASIAAHPWLKQ